MRESNSRNRILLRVRSATGTGPAAEGLGRIAHPGTFLTPPADDPVVAFKSRLETNGGEAVELTRAALAPWISNLVADGTVAVARDVEAPGLRVAPVTAADFGIVRALWAIAETGSLVLASETGRQVQLLPRTLVVLVTRDRVLSRFAEALTQTKGHLPAALGLHSGPSKSADIGQTTVTGVHGPGRLMAVILDE